VQAEQVDTCAAYNRNDWLIEVAAIFPLRINFLCIMRRKDCETKEQQEASRLYHIIVSGDGRARTKEGLYSSQQRDGTLIFSMFVILLQQEFSIGFHCG
jgi:hypothetical protein